MTIVEIVLVGQAAAMATEPTGQSAAKTMGQMELVSIVLRKEQT